MAASPGLSQRSLYQMIYHPSTGLCLQRCSLLGLDITLGPCIEDESWNYTPQGNIVLKGTILCVEALGLGKVARLGMFCMGDNTQWSMMSDYKLHLSTKVEDITIVCLDGSSMPSVVTNKCNCLRRDSSCDPSSQWFKIITTTKSLSLVSGI